MPLRDGMKAGYEVVNYEYVDEDGQPTYEAIEEDDSVAAFRIIKNRRGGGKEQIYAVQTNLDLNRWVYIGELVRAGTGDHNWFKQLSNAS